MPRRRTARHRVGLCKMKFSRWRIAVQRDFYKDLLWILQNISNVSQPVQYKQKICWFSFLRHLKAFYLYLKLRKLYFHIYYCLSHCETHAPFSNFCSYISTSFTTQAKLQSKSFFYKDFYVSNQKLSIDVDRFLIVLLRANFFTVA